MALPFFYNEEITIAADMVVLNEETSKHIVQVLRMQNGEQLQLTDGKGNLFTAEITDNNRKKCTVKITNISSVPTPASSKAIGISLVKNSHRFEWFLEKATEIGITEIYPLICQRTEKQHFRSDRMKTILISAMLQSQQVWLPILHEPIKYHSLVNQSSHQQKFIAHCENEEDKVQLSVLPSSSLVSTLILIGPEGDFTKEEIASALQKDFIPVALGNTRLRTETAGIVAATLLTK
ncbi:16S rRNA (uracil(1498)-N(3))-methyltransferase [Ferruginibacter lapsinanis]|uniref:RsmE family RNA methyltransferase n=1 Tax=Ferruginibacter lapsinanis TaxID=563172 RepID=UPI001E649B71|nr:RsmE family RNA methyltransferase [Ferruginibacter lapsinanis]UEG50365.1 16S rRNA (uracil(1498)-N(3))-methyltransferase [Ferruginibacter lapsinanis]